MTAVSQHPLPPHISKFHTAPPTSRPSRPSLPPKSVRTFPRSNWNGIVFGYPRFAPGEWKLKAEWAGREASRKWAEALRARSLGTLDEVDFAVAVGDMAGALNMWIRRCNSRDGRHLKDPCDWLTATDSMIQSAYNRATAQLHTTFPNDPRLPEITSSLDFVRSYARPALTAQWEPMADSMGLPPENAGFDEVKFTDRFIPVPRPRKYELLDQGRYVWVDDNGSECDSPSASPTASTFASAEAVRSSAQQSPSSRSDSDGTASSGETHASDHASAAHECSTSPSPVRFIRTIRSLALPR